LAANIPKLIRKEIKLARQDSLPPRGHVRRQAAFARMVKRGKKKE
jgi:hypothetical protein